MQGELGKAAYGAYARRLLQRSIALKRPNRLKSRIANPESNLRHAESEIRFFGRYAIDRLNCPSAARIRPD